MFAQTCLSENLGSLWYIVLLQLVVIGPKDADGMANSVGPDQTALLL